MMADPHFQDGKVAFELESRKQVCETYYKIYGDHRRSTPVIVLHGGPGSGHEYVEPFSDLWTRYKIPVILYDQIGCAKSTHLPETKGDISFWQPSLFVAELENLIHNLGLNETGHGYHILGHSWGGSLAVEFAARQPPGLRRLILAGANASLPLLKQNLWDLLKQLPVDQQTSVEEAVKKKDFTGKSYHDAMTAFMSTFLCRGRPFPPPELAADMANNTADSTVRLTMFVNPDAHSRLSVLTRSSTGLAKALSFSTALSETGTAYHCSRRLLSRLSCSMENTTQHNVDLVPLSSNKSLVYAG